MRRIVAIILCLSVSTPPLAMAADHSDLKRQYECLTDAVKFYSSGGKVFSKKGCDIEAEDSWTDGNVVIYSNKKQGKNPTTTYMLRANFSKDVILSGEPSEFISKLTDQYKALSECIAFFMKSGNQRDSRAMNPLYKNVVSVPQHCDQSGGTSTQSDGGRVTLRETVTKITSTDASYLDFVKNITHRY